MTYLFHITIAYDDENNKYCAAAYDILKDEASSRIDGTINKMWSLLGQRIKDKEKLRKNFPVVPKEPSIIQSANGNGELKLPPDRKIIVPG